MKRFVLAQFPVALFALLMILSFNQVAHAQTFKVLHSFTGGTDGGYPQTGLSVDTHGNLFGTASIGGASGGNCAGSGGCGTAYRVTPRSAGWVFSILHSFTGGSDGAFPAGNVAISADGAVYGTTQAGGGDTDCGTSGATGCGTVFQLLPPPSLVCHSVSCPWNETILHSFNGASDSSKPSGVILDSAGNLYGVASGTGNDNGNVFVLSPAGGDWTLSVAYAFRGTPDGSDPIGTLAFDPAGNIYGTTSTGGELFLDAGTVFQLTPSGSGWAENLLNSFDVQSEGAQPMAGVVLDAAGNLYGGTPWGGLGDGTVFQMDRGNDWYMTNLANFGTTRCLYGPYQGVVGSLAMDSNGNLYGATSCFGRSNAGQVFEFTLSNGQYTYHDLYDFRGMSDGSYPNSVALDASGNLYGTTQFGGESGRCPGGCGTVWEITP